MDVVGIRLDADQDHGLAPLPPLLRGVGVEYRGSRGRAWRCRDAVGDRLGLCGRIDTREQQLLELARLDPRDRLLLGDQPLGDHVDRDLDRRLSSALGCASLEHVELAPLNGELEVLHIAVVLLELAGEA